MAEVTRWRELRIGLIGLAGIILVILGVLLFAQIGGIRGKKVTVYVAADATGGLMEGGEVYLSGKRVGKVESIVFRPPSTDTTERLLITAAILEEAMPLIRRDSPVQIGPLGTFLGQPVLKVSAGSSASPRLQAGDTLYAGAFRVSEGVMAQLAVVGKDVGKLRDEFTAVMEDMKTARGTFGAMAVEGPRDMGRVAADFSRFNARLTRGRGTVGLFMNDPSLGARFSSVRANMDSIALLLSSDRGNVGKFRRDKSLGAALESVRDEVASLQQALEESRGTAGRAMNDEAVQEELAVTRQRLAELIADFKKHPFRYIVF
ncbi:MAG TPA: MlaD family protein [Gemmatimonadaceae bacterium]|nr:MlaD family protein [Gemmatimonadaceae bacterium]